MNRFARIIALACPVAWCLATTAGTALGAPANMAALAERSVVTVVNGTRVTTGFAFNDRTLIVGARSRRPSTVIMASGTAGTSVPERETAEISAGSRPEGSPFVVDTKRPANGERAYLLAGPVGYEAGKIRRTTLHFVGSAGGTRVQVWGKLPSSFLGAPVVTAHGQLLGAVAEIGPKSWTLMSVSGLAALVSAIGKTAGGSSNAMFVVIGGALLLVLGLLAVLGFRWRRRTRMRRPRSTIEHVATAEPGRGAAARRHAEQGGGFEAVNEQLGASPALVRRRDGSMLADGDDFDIVVKSHQEQAASRERLDRP